MIMEYMITSPTKNIHYIVSREAKANKLCLLIVTKPRWLNLDSQVLWAKLCSYSDELHGNKFLFTIEDTLYI